MSKIYVNEVYERYGAPKGFDNVTLYHGFNAFCASKPYQYKFETLMNNPQRQICTSTKYLGMMGVTVVGDILMASSYDLGSWIDKDTGYRWFDSRDMDNIVFDYNDLEHHWDDNEENNEIIVTNVKVTSIWVTSDANNKLKALAKALADKYNLPFIEVGESIFN